VYLPAAYLCCVADLRVKINLYFLVQIYMVADQNWHVWKNRSTTPNASWISPLYSSYPSKFIYRSAQFRIG
jgi:hypothetical protein